MGQRRENMENEEERPIWSPAASYDEHRDVRSGIMKDNSTLVGQLVSSGRFHVMIFVQLEATLMVSFGWRSS